MNPQQQHHALQTVGHAQGPALVTPETEQHEVAIPRLTSDHGDSYPVLEPELLPDLPTLAVRINEAHDSINGLIRTSLQHAIRLGRLLLEVKKQVGHGKFTPWVEENCPRLSERTARVYMRVARNASALDLDDESIRQPTAVSSIKAALKSLASPKGEQLALPGLRGSVVSATAEADDDRDFGIDTREAGPADAQEFPDDSTGDNRGSMDLPPSREFEDAGPPPIELSDGQDHEQEQSADVGQQSSMAETRVPDPEAVSTPVERLHEQDEVRPPSTEPNDPPDLQVRLDGLPIRSKLGNPAIFDEQARLYLSLQPVIDLLLQQYQPSQEDMRGAGVLSWVRERYSYRVAFLTGVKRPEEWLVCSSCDGSGKSRSLNMPCNCCKGAGFEVTHEADPPTESSPRDD